jgi:hypothetical protein
MRPRAGNHLAMIHEAEAVVQIRVRRNFAWIEIERENIADRQCSTCPLRAF